MQAGSSESGRDFAARHAEVIITIAPGLDAMKAAYAHAIATGYRFYSYGDASLLLPEG